MVVEAETVAAVETVAVVETVAAVEIAVAADTVVAAAGTVVVGLQGLAGTAEVVLLGHWPGEEGELRQDGEHLGFIIKYVMKDLFLSFIPSLYYIQPRFFPTIFMRFLHMKYLLELQIEVLLLIPHQYWGTWQDSGVLSTKWVSFPTLTSGGLLI